MVLLFFCFSKNVNGQQLCADSSYRIKYIFDGEGATLTNNPDTTGHNYFAGQALRGQTAGLALLKTTWGDSIIWAKKIFSGNTFLNCYNATAAPGGTFILTGQYGGATFNKPELLMCRIDTSGVVLWMKRYKYFQNHLEGGFFSNIPPLIKNNLIYLNTQIYSPGTPLAVKTNSITAKLDLDGNVIWSTNLIMNFLSTGYSANTGITITPTFFNNKIIIAGDSGLSVNNSPGLPTLTELNETDGAVLSSFGYKTTQNNFLIGINPIHINYNYNNTFTLTSQRLIDFFGQPMNGGLAYTQLDTNLNPIKNYCFVTNNLSNYLLSNNSAGNQGILANDGRFGYNNDKYFFNIDNDFVIQRSRKFIIPNYAYNPALYNYYDIRLDDKQNIHFTIQARENNVAVTDYSRISNLAPNSTLGCFGKDTSLLVRQPFTLEKKPFAWDNIERNVLVANDVPYTIQDAIVTKQLVCKIVSYCDTIKITGPTAACVGLPVRYTIRRNSTCLKNTDWSIDTAFASITNLEGDSAITLTFKKPFNGYIHAALSDCVVKDSFLIKAVVPAMPPLISRTDSLLCPGKTLTLNANSGFTNYVWQGTVSNRQFIVGSAGTYRVTATDSCGITRTDSITVTLSDTSLTLATLPAVCLYDSAFINLPNNVSNIVWQPTANSLLRGNTIVAYPAQTTLFTVTAQRQTNCPITRQVVITVKTCPQTFYMPNSFTPNNDGLNDNFKPTISQPLAAYQLTVYNRYGQTIFTTTDQYRGWDGTFKNSRQPMGGYIYQCSYRFNSGTPKTANGYFILLR